MTTALSRWSRKSITINQITPEFEDGGFTGFYRSGSPVGNEELADGFEQLAEQVYKANPVVFSCVQARQMPFAEARFQFQEFVDGRPGKLFDDPSLNVLRNPWPNGTTGELLGRMEQDSSLAGNFYLVDAGGWLARLRPDYVKIVSGVKDEPNAHPLDYRSRPLLYIFEPPGCEPVAFTPDRIVHYSPIPDPMARWRGMSWMTPIVREVQADEYATRHKLNYFRNGAALSLAISYDKDLDPDKFAKYVDLFEDAHRGSANAFRTLHIGGGADPTVLGTELKTDFRAIQGAGETRIAAASGVGAIIARFSEGLQGSALNQGNYGAAKRQVADMVLRPLWRIASAALSTIAPPPASARLWYDARDVEFLKEDQKDAAEITQLQAATINTLVSAGYEPKSVITAVVETDDLTRLEHTGLYSVQLQRAGQSAELTPPQDALVEPTDTTPKGLKVGARNSANDQAHIQTAHDELVSAGADCQETS